MQVNTLMTDSPTTAAPIRIAMSDFAARPGLLAFRKPGRDARETIEAALDAQSDGQPAVLDFDGIDAMTMSFADECVGRLLASRLSRYHDERPVVCANVRDDVQETLDALVKLRGLTLLALDRDWQPVLLSAGDAAPDTLRAVQPLGRFRVADVLGALNLKPPAANGRLKPLVKAGALTRSPLPASATGGKEFEYAVADYRALLGNDA